MIFKQKTRCISKKLTHLKPNDQYYLGVKADRHINRLQELGFSHPLVIGEQMLVSAIYGPASRRNAEGFEIVHRDQEMETAYRQVEWHWTEFRGRYDTQECSKIVDVPYDRYPRTIISPYAVELMVRSREINEIFIVAGPFSSTGKDDHRETNTANMFMELFGECIVLQPDLSIWKKVQTRQLNWQLLPPGKNPWSTAQSNLRQVIKRAKKGIQPVIGARFDAIGEYGPEYIAIGLGGFDGYVAFGFPRLGICILESRSVNNATYVLDEGTWESISMLSKAEILDAKSHRRRLIHRESWFREIIVLLNNMKAS